MKRWRCNVCGYIHEGEAPPEKCPICGVGPEEFSLQTEKKAAKPAGKRWKCTVCDYVHNGEEPPEKCPLCGVDASQFVLLLDEISQLTAEAVQGAGLDTANSAVDKISYGLYVVTSIKDNKINGQCCNTLFQLTSKPLRVAVCLNKKNLTHDYLLDSGVLAVSLLSREQSEAVRWFGYQSGRTTDKFATQEYLAAQNGCPILKNCLAYIEARVLPEKTVDVGTHTLFVADVTAGRMVADQEAMTYSFYQKNK